MGGLMSLENLIRPALISPTIRIDKRYDFSLGDGKTKIAGIAAEFPFGELIESDIRESLFNRTGHAIRGAVNDDDLKKLICVLVFQGFEAAFDQVSGIIGRDND
jgi:hypothetical protein